MFTNPKHAGASISVHLMFVNLKTLYQSLYVCNVTYLFTTYAIVVQERSQQLNK